MERISFSEWVKRRAQSFAHAGRGILLLCVTQWNFRIQLIAALVAVALGFYFQVSAIEWIILTAAIGLVLCSEALNTAVERVVDLLELDHHPVARDAKGRAAKRSRDYGVLQKFQKILRVSVVNSFFPCSAGFAR